MLLKSQKSRVLLLVIIHRPSANLRHNFFGKLLFQSKKGSVKRALQIIGRFLFSFIVFAFEVFYSNFYILSNYYIQPTFHSPQSARRKI